MTAEIQRNTRSIQILLMYKDIAILNQENFKYSTILYLYEKNLCHENFSEISQNLFFDQSILFHHNSIFFHLHLLPYLIFSPIFNSMRDRSSQRTLCLMRMNSSQGKSHFKCFFVVMQATRKSAVLSPKGRTK